MASLLFPFGISLYVDIISYPMDMMAPQDGHFTSFQTGIISIDIIPYQTNNRSLEKRHLILFSFIRVNIS